MGHPLEEEGENEGWREEGGRLEGMPCCHSARRGGVGLATGLVAGGEGEGGQRRGGGVLQEWVHCQLLASGMAQSLEQVERNGLRSGAPVAEAVLSVQWDPVLVWIVVLHQRCRLHMDNIPEAAQQGCLAFTHCHCLG